jgi:hypothetical protein
MVYHTGGSIKKASAASEVLGSTPTRSISYCEETTALNGTIAQAEGIRRIRRFEKLAGAYSIRYSP